MKQDDFQMNDDFTNVYLTLTFNVCVHVSLFFLIKRTITEIESFFKAIENEGEKTSKFCFSKLNNCHNSSEMT